MHVAGIFCDLVKASDCVHHGRLLPKLHVYSIWGNSAAWFMPCLTKGTQFEIKLPNATQTIFSGYGTLKYRVPQGSILGQLLFIIHIHHLPQRINSVSEPILFADDTNGIISNRNFGAFVQCRLSFLSYN